MCADMGLFYSIASVLRQGQALRVTKSFQQSTKDGWRNTTPTMDAAVALWRRLQEEGALSVLASLQAATTWAEEEDRSTEFEGWQTIALALHRASFC